MSSNEREHDRKFILELIEVYRSSPALWDIKGRDYSNRIEKNDQYEELLRKYKEKYLDADKQEVKKINSSRTNFRKELKRISDSERSGIGADDVVEPSLWYFEEMPFIIGLEEAGNSQNTMSSECEGEKETESESQVADNSARKITVSMS
ncbi:hypothetical protein JTB14_037166 [Gonioctena quinquepunctata]|nr:hypothetical protein JTB14_037166 [Gonioctena quinquepunctata]